MAYHLKQHAAVGESGVPVALSRRRPAVQVRPAAPHLGEGSEVTERGGDPFVTGEPEPRPEPKLPPTLVDQQKVSVIGPVKVVEGDCVEVMRALAENSVDSLCTDPPYGLEFMGKEWDSFGRKRNYKPLTEDGHGNTGILPMYGRGGTPQDRDVFHRKANVAAQEWHHAWAVEALRVLKPGGHLLAFGGTRTAHRLACALEDAGFEIRDTMMWLYGQGFPKSLDVSKAIDKAAGAEREVIGRGGVRSPRRPVTARTTRRLRGRIGYSDNPATPGGGGPKITAPATDDAKRWSGWGTALKPAFEPIILARKPLSEASVAANVLRWGTGALNIDGGRIGWASASERAEVNQGASHSRHAPEPETGVTGWGSGRVRDRDDLTHAAGRWPANVLLSHAEGCEQVGTRRVKGARWSDRDVVEQGGFTGQDIGAGVIGPHYIDADGLEEVEAWHCEPGCPVRLLDEQSGDRSSPRAGGNPNNPKHGQQHAASSYGWGYERESVDYRDRGAASRFFYCGKAAARERWAFCKRCDIALSPDALKVHDGRLRTRGALAQDSDAEHLKDVVRHPTQKPVDLMRYLIRLVAPPGATVLDPFAGSGTTGVAAWAEGVDVVLVERDPEYAAIVRARCSA